MIGSSLRRSPVLLALAATAAVAALTGCSGGSSTAAASSAPASTASPAGTSAPATAGTGAGAGSGGGTTAPAATPSAAQPAGAPADPGDCPSVALVRTTLGLAVGKPAANSSAADVVVCSYPKDGNPSAVIVRMQDGQTKAGFAAAKAGFAKSGQKTVDVPDMFDGAYRSELGSATYGFTRTLVVLRGSTEVLVTAQATFDGLTKLTHTMLD